jgi:hypothetical protein
MGRLASIGEPPVPPDEARNGTAQLSVATGRPVVTSGCTMYRLDALTKSILAQTSTLKQVIIPCCNTASAATIATLDSVTNCLAT